MEASRVRRPLRALRGPDRAFEQLYRRHAREVYQYALAVLANPADAEDVTQQTFLNAYRAFQRGDRPEKPHNWLIAIAHNVCRMRWRQAGTRPKEVALEAAPEPAVREDERPDLDEVLAALASLTFNQRTALVMRELEGRSYQEIAEILGVSVSAVETLIFRARRALREQLEDGITCQEAGLSISKQLDGRLSRKERGALRAHLRECEDCSTFARSQRAHRGALKSLALIPLPQSLVGLFGGGGGAAVGGSLAIKAAVVGAGAILATGVGYESVHHGIVPGVSSTQAAAKKQAQRPVAKPPLTQSASVIAPAQEARHDQKPFTPRSVKARTNHRERAGRSPAVAPERLAKPIHKEVSPLPPSRDRGHGTPVKPEKVNPNPNRGLGNNRGHRNVPPPKPPKVEKPPKDKSGGGGTGSGEEELPPTEVHGKSSK